MAGFLRSASAHARTGRQRHNDMRGLSLAELAADGQLAGSYMTGFDIRCIRKNDFEPLWSSEAAPFGKLVRR
jgi:hypothetical protein